MTDDSPSTILDYVEELERQIEDLEGRLKINREISRVYNSLYRHYRHSWRDEYAILDDQCGGVTFTTAKEMAAEALFPGEVRMERKITEWRPYRGTGKS